MEMEDLIVKISHIEEQITLNINLLEIARGYCEYNFDKACEISTLGSLIEIILDNQQNLAKNVDGIL